MASKEVSVAIIGLGFGARFIPIYQHHPQAELGAVCRRDSTALNRTADLFGVERRYTDYNQVLQDQGIDCVHINSPVDDHGWMSIAALKAGKHVLCAVPMATTIEECEKICALVEQTGLKYMMAETAIYNREYLYVSSLNREGKLGQIQYLQASHPQDMEGWPEYWQTMAPMHYSTHSVAAVLSIVNGRAEYVSCFGSGRVRDDIANKSGNRYAVESCNIEIVDSDVSAHVWRCLFDTARQYRESLNVYGSKRSFEWSLSEGEAHLLHTAKQAEADIPSKVILPDYSSSLPDEIRQFTHATLYGDQPWEVKVGGSGGSHPHLVHEFISAVVDDRDPHPNALSSANWSCVGICAHQSTRQGGKIVLLPSFTLAR